jgi:hypothetical protein
MINPASPKKGSKYGPTSSPNFELEVALVVNGCTNIEGVSGGCGGGWCWGGTMIGRPMTAKEAQGKIFGCVQINIWSTSNVQRWECIPLGPFRSKNENKQAVIWVRADRTMASPHPPAPVAIPSLLSYLSGGSDGRKNPMGRILRHNDKDNDDDDDGYYGGGYGNGGMVRGRVGRRLHIDNSDSLDNRLTTTKERGWDPPHPWQCCSGGQWRTAAKNGTNFWIWWGWGAGQ